MRTLILRTFAHPNIWEGNEEFCHFELNQKKQILEWEPYYMNFKTEVFDRAIGIYTEKYFSGYFDVNTQTKKVAYSGTGPEKTISAIHIISRNNNPFPVLDNKNRIYITIEFKGKLWTTPNKDLMLKIDDELIKAKIAELNSAGVKVTDSRFKPLSFSLDSETTNYILENTRL